MKKGYTLIGLLMFLLLLQPIVLEMMTIENNNTK